MIRQFTGNIVRTLTATLASVLLAACSGSGGDTSAATASATPVSAATAGAQSPSAAASNSPTTSVVATSTPAKSPVDTSAPVELTWWTGQSEAAQQALEKLAKEFSALHPNVKITASPGAPSTDDLLQKLTAALASKKYPDISYAYGSWATELSQSGKTLDISELIRDPAVAWDQFPEAARLTASPGGKVLGFPAIVDNLALIYNPALFAAAGVAEPTGDWTWEQFREAAKRISDPAKKIYGTAYSVSGSEDTTWHLWPMLWQRGGDVLSPDGKTATFNSQAGVDSLELLRAMAVDDKSMYLDQTDEKYLPLFADGRIGMVITGPWALYDLVQKKTPYKVAALPGIGGDHQTVSGPDVWAMFDHKDDKRAYWSFELLKWLTSSEVDLKWNVAQGNLPLRSTEKDSAEFAAYVKAYPGADVLFGNLANAKKARPTVSGYVELSRHVGEAVSKVLQGAQQPKAALDEAAAKADQALAGG